MYKLVYKGKYEVINGYYNALARRSELQRLGFNPALKFAQCVLSCHYVRNCQYGSLTSVQVDGSDCVMIAFYTQVHLFQICCDFCYHSKYLIKSLATYC